MHCKNIKIKHAVLLCRYNMHPTAESSHMGHIMGSLRGVVKLTGHNDLALLEVDGSKFTFKVICLRSLRGWKPRGTRCSMLAIQVSLSYCFQFPLHCMSVSICCEIWIAAFLPVPTVFTCCEGLGEALSLCVQADHLCVTSRVYLNCASTCQQESNVPTMAWPHLNSMTNIAQGHLPFKNHGPWTGELQLRQLEISKDLASWLAPLCADYKIGPIVIACHREGKIMRHVKHSRQPNRMAVWFSI